MPLSAPAPTLYQPPGSSKDKVATNKLLAFVRASSPVPNILSFGSNANYSATPPPHRRRLSKASTLSSTSTTTEPSSELGGPFRPILHFRPNLWRHLDRDRETLNLDLFWPIKIFYDDDLDESCDNNEPSVFPPSDFDPLHSFHRLRSLHLSGMMRSYQRHIWLAVWLNPDLKDLTLEMALEPVIASDCAHRFRKVDRTWECHKLTDTNGNPSASSAMIYNYEHEYEYLGAHGQGILHAEFGDGEYLDRQAIALARLEASSTNQRNHYNPSSCLAITTLTLQGFVVDAGPFMRSRSRPQGAVSLFHNLSHLVLKDHCLDAGLVIPPRSDAQVANPCTVAWAGTGSARHIRPGTVKLVEVKTQNSQLTNRTGPGAVNGTGTKLRSKLSGILPRWRSNKI